VADPDGEAVDSPAGIQRLGAVAEDRGAGCGDGDLVDEQARPDQAASVVYRNRSSIVWPWYADRSGVAADVAVAREAVRPAIPGSSYRTFTACPVPGRSRYARFGHSRN
jgi:hypothetical protein